MTVNCNRHFSGDTEAARRLLPPDWPHRQASQMIKSGELDWHIQFHSSRKPSGLTLLLLHGTGSSTHSWADLIDGLREFACVLAVDLPGHGFTRGANQRMLTLPGMADELQRLFNVLQLQGQIAMVGHSAGAPLAIEWALKFARQSAPLQLAHIIGLNPSLVPPPLLYTTMLGPVVAPIATSSPMTGMLAFIAANTRMVDQLLDSTASKIPETHRRNYRYLFSQPNHVHGAMGFMAGADLPSILERGKSLRIATHFLIGAQDTWVKEGPLKEVIQTSFPRAGVTTWPGGHLLHEEKPAEVVRYIQTIIFTA